MTPNTAKPGDTIPELEAEELQLPVVIRRNETYVRERFWTKLRRVIGRIPFAEDIVASYYCAIDPKTPLRVRAILLAALAYFVMPADIIPDIVTGLGFTDDATVLMTAIGLVGGAVKERHRDRARSALLRPRPAPDRD